MHLECKKMKLAESKQLEKSTSQKRRGGKEMRNQDKAFGGTQGWSYNLDIEDPTKET